MIDLSSFKEDYAAISAFVIFSVSHMPRRLTFLSASSLIFSAFLLGCAVPSGNIRKLPDGSFMLRQEDHAGIFGSMGQLKKNVNKEASDYAKKQNKTLEVVDEQEHSVGVAGDWAWYSVRFILRGDPAEEKPSKPSAGEISANCFSRLKENPEFQVLRGKLFTDDSASRFDALTNNTKPTKAEKATIRIFYAQFMACFTPFDEAFRAAPREVGSLFLTLKNGFDALFVALYKGETTYGAFNLKTEELRGNFLQSSDRIYAELDKEERANNLARMQLEAQTQQAQASMNLAAAQRQANWMQAFQNVQQNMLQMQTINSINRLSAPSPRLGVNCTSRSLGGGTINTNCY